MTAQPRSTTSTDISLEQGLLITVSSGIGTAGTALAAFDAALREAGVANFNLVHISSVIPAGSTVLASGDNAQAPPGSWGDRLYVVLADCRVQVHNEEAWAGIGWAQDEHTGRGLFVEHTGHSKLQVEADIDASLTSLMAGRPEIAFGQRYLVLRGTICHDEPVCALVAAAFESAGWGGPRVIDIR